MTGPIKANETYIDRATGAHLVAVRPCDSGWIMKDAGGEACVRHPRELRDVEKRDAGTPKRAAKWLDEQRPAIPRTGETE